MPAAGDNWKMAPRTCLTLVLAAGEGTRMKSDLPKVLHAAAGRTLVGHAVSTALEAGQGRLAVVVGPGREDVADEGTAVRMDHIARATRRECVKVGRPLSDSEVAAWA